jgi:hypothetical protein
MQQLTQEQERKRIDNIKAIRSLLGSSLHEAVTLYDFYQGNMELLRAEGQLFLHLHRNLNFKSKLAVKGFLVYHPGMDESVYKETLSETDWDRFESAGCIITELVDKDETDNLLAMLMITKSVPDLTLLNKDELTPYQIEIQRMQRQIADLTNRE